VFVANTLSDSISVVDLKSSQKVAEISLGPQTPWSLADEGERLFHDARLSSDGWFSCHSCHTDGHSNGQLNDNLSDETVGTPKRVLSLLGVGDTGPWAWNGSVEVLRQQIRKSIEVTMQGPTPTDQQVRAIEAYLRTLRPAPSLARARGCFDAAAAERGRLVFEQQGCVDCHERPRYTSSDAYDVGLEDESGHTLFNPPSLRGVSQRDPLLHDNRARGLREVLTFHNRGVTAELTPNELQDLLSFLESI
jgi:YVTN family beta-propeller protein